MDNPKVKAQVSLEFAATFVMVVLFVVLIAKVFAWFGKTMIDRHKAYEDTRTMTTETAKTGVDFFTPARGKKPLDVFNQTK